MRGGYEMTSTCIQGGLPRALGGYQSNMTIGPHSPTSAWQFHSVVPKQERPTEGRNDSGINSGSDCQSSSPGSEPGQDVYLSPTNQIPRPNDQTYYSTPLISRIPTSVPGDYTTSQSFPRNFSYVPNPLASVQPFPSVSQIKTETVEEKDEEFASAGGFMTPVETEGSGDALKKLQMSFERNNLLPPGSSESPKHSEHSADDDAKSDNDLEEYDENGLRIPRINSHGKVKTFKCKQCDFVAITKLDFWEHAKTHIKADKLLTCPKCPFVTELKHHLEYHLRNHVGSKPFKCDKCSYTCVNKSMLNSHLKSHSNVYQYRCAECSYATKYCHSLKLHLRKYNHKPAMVLNLDGSPNPLPIIDVYGTRRGPKLKNFNSNDDSASPKEQPNSILSYPLQQLMMNHPPMQFPFSYPLLSNSIFQNLERLARGGTSPAASEENEGQMEEESHQDDNGALDLSKDSAAPVSKNRRKGKAFKLNNLAQNASDDEEYDEMSTTVFSNVEVVQTEENSSNNNNNNKDDDFSCQYCNIAFGDPVLHTMHMGYHGFNNPFTCNMCGQECKDKVSFFVHIARTPH